MGRKGFLLLIVVVLVLVCFQTIVKAGEISLKKEQEGTIEKYLKQEVLKPNFGGDIFTAYEMLASNEKLGEIYVWALISEYYIEDKVIESGTSMSVPLVLHVNDSERGLEILSYTMPGDGYYYEKDIKKQFPKRIHSKIFNYSSVHINKLIKEIEEKVENWMS
ncbi:hypothetical protein [Sutcliffiella cohnii]|uniref:hypothetical protein n=1 Tax=Sutcliffiella cohnii TaxID=33932 RepID=UPI002E24A986|nr:hypothetical protein [Sutcliffiella cohnii]